MADDVTSRAGNVLNVFLSLLSLAALLVAGFFIGKGAQWIVTNVLPLMLLSGAIGFLLLIVGYVVGVSTVLWIGGGLIIVPIFIGLLAAIADSV